MGRAAVLNTEAMTTAGPGITNPTAGVGDGDNQGTPLWLFRLLDAEFRFTGDMFANDANALCKWYHTAENPWQPCASIRGRSWFANPPYSRARIGPAMDTVRAAQAEGSTVVTLTRLEPGAKWFRVNRNHAQELRMLDCRLRFRGQSHSYNFPCCVSVFRPGVSPSPLHSFVWQVAEHRSEAA